MRKKTFKKKTIPLSSQERLVKHVKKARAKGTLRYQNQVEWSKLLVKKGNKIISIDHRIVEIIS